MIRVAAPMLDLVLAVGHGLSRVLTCEAPDLMAPRMPRPGERAPRGARPAR